MRASKRNLLAFFLNCYSTPERYLLRAMISFKYATALLLTAAFSAPSSAEVNSIYISSRLDPNAIIITQVDIVFVYDQDILDEFPSTKTAWYSNQRRFISEAGDKIDLVSVFIPQGFYSQTVSLPERKSDSLGTFVFAQHDDSEAPPVDISSLGRVLIEIDEFGILVSRQE